MYHIQNAHVSFREMNFSAAGRKIANWFYRIFMAIQKSREKEVERILAQHRIDGTLINRSLRKF